METLTSIISFYKYVKRRNRLKLLFYGKSKAFDVYSPISCTQSDYRLNFNLDHKSDITVQNFQKP